MSTNWPALLYDKIKSDVSFWKLIGGRIYPEIAPGNVANPYIVWSQVSTDSETADDGPSNVDRILVQFTVWADTVTEATSIRRQLRTMLEGKYLLGRGDADETNAPAITFSNELMNYDSTARLHGAILELVLTTTDPNN